MRSRVFRRDPDPKGAGGVIVEAALRHRARRSAARDVHEVRRGLETEAARLAGRSAARDDPAALAAAGFHQAVAAAASTAARDNLSDAPRPPDDPATPVHDQERVRA